MDRCMVRPYEGNENYIFISYCHADSESVFPIIEHLAGDGYRIWYDEGIDPGSEWPEIIAQHLNAASVCIAFISRNAVASHNCRREINFACQREKKLISVFLEDAQMSLGMEMQLTSNQFITKYNIPELDFYYKLYDSKDLGQCKGNPHQMVNRVDKTIIENNPIVEPNIANEEGHATAETPQVVPTIMPSVDKKKLYLLRVKTGEKVALDKESLTMGRSESRSEYVITGNSGISRHHATIIRRGDDIYVVDNESVNKTYLNSQELIPQKEYQVHIGDSVKLYNERFRLECE